MKQTKLDPFVARGIQNLRDAARRHAGEPVRTRVDVLYDSLATETWHFFEKGNALIHANALKEEDDVIEVQIDGEKV